MPSLPSQSRRSSPPRRALSSSATPHLEHVAYPFPRLTIAPQAPVCKDDELTPYPKRQKLRINRNWTVPKWLGILVLFMLLGVIYFVTRSDKKIRATDHIPFTQNPAREYGVN